MIATITPAGCGTRRRQHAALLLFTVGAVTAAAAVGAAAAVLGSALGRREALLLALVVAGLAAVREAGVLRVPVPQARRQVPERWRRELPLPLWSLGYGAGMGAGVFTHQPVATLWAALAGAAA